MLHHRIQQRQESMTGLSFLKTRLTRLQGTRGAIAIGLVACALTASSLLVGRVTDDFYWSAVFSGSPGLPEVDNAMLDTFSFGKGTPEEHAKYLARGVVPWWSDPGWKISFWRPLASLSHYIDFTLWKNHTWLMHLHSMLLYGFLAFATTRLYQRHISPSWIAGLAGLLFAVDSAHGLSVSWLSNRNAILSALFAVLVLLAHDSWRQHGRLSRAFVAALMLVLGLFSGEGTVAVAGYLFAYACFIDRSPWRSRIVSLVPYAVIIVIWRILYSMLGYGVTASSFYTDPVADPVGFAFAVVKFFPVLLYSQFMFPDPIYHTLLPPLWTGFYIAFAAGVALLLAWLFWPLLRSSRAARFYAAGMALCAIPYCSSVPQYRLLMLVGIGGMGLLGVFLGGVAERASWFSAGHRSPATLRAAAAFLIVLHLVVSPIMLPANAYSMHYVGKIVDVGNESLPGDEELANDRLIILNATGDIMYAMLPMLRSAREETVPRSMWVLYSGNREIAMYRPSQNVLELSIPDGWMEYPWSFFFCRLPESTMNTGHVVETDGMRVTVLAVNSAGRPVHVRFEFDQPLESDSLRWYTWQDRAYRPMELPQIGGSKRIPALPITTAVRQILEAEIGSLLHGTP
jgi:hypothetical protein